MEVEKRLAAAGFELPAASVPPAANYVPWVQSGNLVFISGQVPMKAGKITHKGKLGAEFSVEDGQACAQVCALNAINHMRAACDGDLSRVARVVKLTGFVNATPDFESHHLVLNGASDLMAVAFGEKGRHSRSAVAAPSLPFGCAVEVEAIFEISPKPANL